MTHDCNAWFVYSCRLRGVAQGLSSQLSTLQYTSPWGPRGSTYLGATHAQCGDCVSFITSLCLIRSRQVYFCIHDSTAVLIVQIACLAHFFLFAPGADTAYPLSQILAVVGAGRSTFVFNDSTAVLILQLACLAHFFLVVGRFTGIESHCSFLAIKRWLASHL